MASDAEKLARDRMAANPFFPMTDAANNDYRQSHALEYIAFYLGEINNHMAQIASTLQASGSNGAALVMHLRGIAHSLQSKT
jgi:hypothetical protein